MEAVNYLFAVYNRCGVAAPGVVFREFGSGFCFFGIIKEVHYDEFVFDASIHEKLVNLAAPATRA